MRPSKLSQILAICLAIFVLPATVSAQEAAKDASAPPKLEPLGDVGDSTVITSKPDAEKKVTEKRRNGRVTEVKVKSGKSTYYLKPNVPAGNAHVGDAQSNTVRPAQWKVMEFELGKKKGQAKPDDANSPPPPPTESTAPTK